MFSFFFSFIFFLLFIVLMVSLGVLSFVSRLFFGKGRRTTRQRSEIPNTDEEPSATSFFSRRKKKKKIFDPNDGEYIDYVEVKE